MTGKFCRDSSERERLSSTEEAKGHRGMVPLPDSSMQHISRQSLQLLPQPRMASASPTVTPQDHLLLPGDPLIPTLLFP